MASKTSPLNSGEFYAFSKHMKEWVVLRIGIALAYILIAWKWGDWRNWKKYEATILFYITGDLLYNFMLYNYPMWEFIPDHIITKETLIILLSDFVDFPCIFLIFLPYLPKSLFRRMLYILLWGTILAALEWIFHKSGKITYHHGWNLWWSFLFDYFVFFIVSLHYKKRLLAYVLSVFVVISLMIIFRVPTSSMK